MTRHSRETWKSILRVVAAVGFVAAGANHFRITGTYQKIIPPAFPSPRLLVQISGICEIVGGLALLIPALRRLAGWGLIALLIAVFPANIYMAIHSDRFSSHYLPAWLLWLRLPMQLLFIAWIWFVSTPRKPRGNARRYERRDR